MKEILPGIFHWTATHPKIGIEVSSYYLAEERVLLDPLLPDEGLDPFPGMPEHVVLTNRHHWRHSGEFVERFGCTVWCVEQGMHEFTSNQPVRPFPFGAVLAGGILALEVGVLCPDETALLVPRQGGVLAIADGVIRDREGPLTFVPDAYLGDDPAAVKKGLKESYRRLVDEHDFDHLLLAHGWPWLENGKQALRAFVEA